MNQKNNGGAAFPTTDHQAAHTIAAAAINGIENSAERDRVYAAARAQVQQGMTLRDYFAAAAPITATDAMLACGVDAASIGMLPASRRTVVLVALATMRGEYADAMLAERAK